MVSLFLFFFFFSSRRRHTRCSRDWSSDVCSSDNSKYQLQSGTHRLRQIPLPASRGLITDRNGKILAENLPGYTVSLLPAADEDSLRAALKRIASIVKLDSAGIERVLARYRRTP